MKTASGALNLMNNLRLLDSILTGPAKGSRPRKVRKKWTH